MNSKIFFRSWPCFLVNGVFFCFGMGREKKGLGVVPKDNFYFTKETPKMKNKRRDTLEKSIQKKCWAHLFFLFTFFFLWKKLEILFCFFHSKNKSTKKNTLCTNITTDSLFWRHFFVTACSIFGGFLPLTPSHPSP